MLSNYINSAMKKAVYEILTDDNSYYGEIPGFAGVIANSENLEDCREQLKEVLEEWILVRVSQNLPLPELDGIKLSVTKVA
jgi:predicted RNase H-like HicB family nuclease